jgi:hypothetical protein
VPDNQSPPRDGASPAPKAAKKRYEKPAVKFERVFETTALACGKISATQGQCRLNRKAS